MYPKELRSCLLLYQRIHSNTASLASACMEKWAPSMSSCLSEDHRLSTPALSYDPPRFLWTGVISFRPGTSVHRRRLPGCLRLKEVASALVGRSRHLGTDADLTHHTRVDANAPTRQGRSSAGWKREFHVSAARVTRVMLYLVCRRWKR
jgi:hypothetical protein